MICTLHKSLIKNENIINEKVKTIDNLNKLSYQLKWQQDVYR